MIKASAAPKVTFNITAARWKFNIEINTCEEMKNQTYLNSVREKLAPTSNDADE